MATYASRSSPHTITHLAHAREALHAPEPVICARDRSVLQVYCVPCFFNWAKETVGIDATTCGVCRASVIEYKMDAEETE